MDRPAVMSFPASPAAAPAVQAAFAPPRPLPEAEAFTRQLATSHYENFPVVSRLLPEHLRQDFCNIYSFCRIADDLGDAMPDRESATAALSRFRDATRACFEGEHVSALFVALGSTIRVHEIPIEPFLDLIDAFEQDQTVTRYDTFDQLLDYCTRSANPVGRLVLYLCGYRDEHRQRLSDRTCTALQLTNFWQDIRRDLIELDRIYLPADVMRRFGISEEQICAGRVDDAFRRMLCGEVERTVEMFDEGEELLPLLDRSIRSHVALFTSGGRAILEAIRRQDYDTLSRRPVLSAWQKSRLVAAGISARMRAAIHAPPMKRRRRA
jgi:squalene synthase HpnC